MDLKLIQKSVWVLTDSHLTVVVSYTADVRNSPKFCYLLCIIFGIVYEFFGNTFVNIIMPALAAARSLARNFHGLIIHHLFRNGKRCIAVIVYPFLCNIYRSLVGIERYVRNVGILPELF